MLTEFSDHLSTITGMLEFNQRLITCSNDKNLVVYDIVKQQSAYEKRKGSVSLWSCFLPPKIEKPQPPEKQTYKYVKHNIIVNAHSSGINCIANVADKYFATGSTKEIKIWKFYECVHIIPNAHQNSILSLKLFSIMNYHDRRNELFLASGGKDKQLKLWGMDSLLESQSSQASHAPPMSVRNSNEMTLSHFSQVNTFQQLSDTLILTGTSDGKIQFWKQRSNFPRESLGASQNMQSRFFQNHSAQVFTVSTLHIQLL